MLPLSGRARRLGDNVGNDAILSAMRRYETLDPVQLRRYLFEGRDPGFASSIREGDILVAGRHFGGGSATELTVTTVLCAGVRAIVARSFSRSYLRDAFNNGLFAVCANTDDIVEGDAIMLSDSPDGGVELYTARRRILCDPLPRIARDLLEAGGMVPYLRAHGGFGPELPGEMA